MFVSALLLVMMLLSLGIRLLLSLLGFENPSHEAQSHQEVFAHAVCRSMERCYSASSRRSC